MTEKNRILLISTSSQQNDLSTNAATNSTAELADEMHNQKLNHALTQAGYLCLNLTLEQLASELQHTQKSDILIFNLENFKSPKAFEAASALALTIKSNPQTNSVKILCIEVSLNSDSLNDVTNKDDNSDLEDDHSTTPGNDNYNHNHGFDDLISGAVRPPSVIARLKSLTRISTIHKELNRRHEISKQYDHLQSKSPSPEFEPSTTLTNAALTNATLTEATLSDATILVTGRPNGFGRIEQTLSPYATLLNALSIEAAKEYLTRKPIDMLIINGGKSPTRYLELAEHIRKNSEFYTLPILMIAHPSNLSTSHIAYEAGVTDIIEAPLNKTELLLRSGTLVKERRFKTNIKGTYLSARHLPTNDALTGLYNYSYFRQHLGALLKEQQTKAQSFTLVTLTIENLEQINQKNSMAEGDKILRQVAEILMIINRGEDLLSRTSGNKFTISLPETTAAEAINVVERAEGIIKQTEFINHETMNRIEVHVTVSISESNQKSTLQSLLKTMHHQFTNQSEISEPSTNTG